MKLFVFLTKKKRLIVWIVPHCEIYEFNFHGKNVRPSFSDNLKIKTRITKFIMPIAPMIKKSLSSSTIVRLTDHF